MLVCHPDAAKPPAEGALERDNYSQSGSSEEDEDYIFGWPYDDIEESEEESESSEEDIEAAPTDFSHHGALEDSGQIEDQEQNAEVDDPLILPYTSDIEEFSPSCSSDDTEHVWRGENRLENFLISHQSEHQSNDNWRMAKETMTDFDGNKICTGPANGRRYDREMHLVLLRTCRQVYAEANQVLWETNIFSFNDAPSFTRYMGSRSAFQKRSIKKLRLAIDWNGDVSQWNSIFNMSLVRSLQCLRELWLFINHFVHRADYITFKVDSPFMEFTEGSNLPGIRKLATLPLKKVNVCVVHDPHDQDPYSRYHGPSVIPWNAEDRQDYANRIRDRLLDPNGAEIYAKEVEREVTRLRRN